MKHAQGQARIETYTLVYDKHNQAKRAIIIGRLNSGERFLANAERDSFNELSDQQCVGREGLVKSISEKNVFELK